MKEIRKDQLTAQKVGIAMVFREMLGPDDARAYLSAENIPEPVIERVLAGETIRLDQGSAAPQGTEASEAAEVLPQPPDLNNIFYGSSGRRRNTVKAAIVEAAITIADQLGRDRAEQLLRREQLPDEVIARVLAPEDAARRARPA
ncbi:hypothetical protein OU994_15660 [Pseudoduganella sp. SL102]|uniref:hypothetical protein n=1 Tax=Pseudoduganella sp. SL102 TaxID=2995154 RepID=UPI00248C79F0|nr:hypothetical protein [Pseudoduganella sp. SL102]WBS05619.1 hypothetical protein OU994_15660 [Pseudoduganella sp. SL102]